MQQIRILSKLGVVLFVILFMGACAGIEAPNLPTVAPGVPVLIDPPASKKVKVVDRCDKADDLQVDILVAMANIAQYQTHAWVAHETTQDPNERQRRVERFKALERDIRVHMESTVDEWDRALSECAAQPDNFMEWPWSAVEQVCARAQNARQKFCIVSSKNQQAARPLFDFWITTARQTMQFLLAQELEERPEVCKGFASACD